MNDSPSYVYSMLLKQLKNLINFDLFAPPKVWFQNCLPSQGIIGFAKPQVLTIDIFIFNHPFPKRLLGSNPIAPISSLMYDQHMGILHVKNEKR
jgi:hypothetical protein